MSASGPSGPLVYARMAEAPGTFLSVDSLKTSALDSVTAYI